MLHNEVYFNYIFLLGLFFIIFSFIFKIGIFPFHFWVIDLYNTASLSVILFISTIPKIAYFNFIWVILKFFYSFDDIVFDSVLRFFVFLLVFSLIFVFVKAINEFNFFKLFAYSGIGIIVLLYCLFFFLRILIWLYLYFFIYIFIVWHL
jgi:NADH-quinone oxidoreductase subunit N